MPDPPPACVQSFAQKAQMVQDIIARRIVRLDRELDTLHQTIAVFEWMEV